MAASSSNPSNEDLSSGAEQVAEAAKNPELMQRMVESALDHITPEDVNRQRQHLNGAQGQKIFAALKKKGIKPADLRKQILNTKSSQGREIHKMMQDAPLVVVVKSNKVLSKHVLAGEEEFYIKRVTGSETVMSPCSKLSSEDHTIFVCSEAKGKVNKRASLMVGYNVYGEVLFGRKEGDLTIEQFAALESIHGRSS